MHARRESLHEDEASRVRVNHRSLEYRLVPDVRRENTDRDLFDRIDLGLLLTARRKPRATSLSIPSATAGMGLNPVPSGWPAARPYRACRSARHRYLAFFPEPQISNPIIPPTKSSTPTRSAPTARTRVAGPRRFGVPDGDSCAGAFHLVSDSAYCARSAAYRRPLLPCGASFRTSHLTIFRSIPLTIPWVGSAKCCVPTLWPRAVRWSARSMGSPRSTRAASCAVSATKTSGHRPPLCFPDRHAGGSDIRRKHVYREQRHHSGFGAASFSGTPHIGQQFRAGVGAPRRR